MALAAFGPLVFAVGFFSDFGAGGFSAAPLEGVEASGDSVGSGRRDRGDGPASSMMSSLGLMPGQIRRMRSNSFSESSGSRLSRVRNVLRFPPVGAISPNFVSRFSISRTSMSFAHSSKRLFSTSASTRNLSLLSV